MASSLEESLAAFKEWKESACAVAVRLQSGRYWLTGCGAISEISSSTVCVSSAGFNVEIDLSSARGFDWRPGDDVFEPLLRICGLGYDCVIFPLKEKPLT